MKLLLLFFPAEFFLSFTYSSGADSEAHFGLQTKLSFPVAAEGMKEEEMGREAGQNNILHAERNWHPFYA